MLPRAAQVGAALNGSVCHLSRTGRLVCDTAQQLHQLCRFGFASLPQESPEPTYGDAERQTAEEMAVSKGDIIDDVHDHRKVSTLLSLFRRRGHLIADLDPLRRGGKHGRGPWKGPPSPAVLGMRDVAPDAAARGRWAVSRCSLDSRFCSCMCVSLFCKCMLLLSFFARLLQTTRWHAHAKRCCPHNRHTARHLCAPQGMIGSTQRPMQRCA